jgi:hypothetical protein
LHQTKSSSEPDIPYLSRLKLAQKTVLVAMFGCFMRNLPRVRGKFPLNKNMKNKLLLLSDKMRLNQRGIIESVNDQLKTLFFEMQ